jgi:Protein of unknown function (DUF3618)
MTTGEVPAQSPPDDVQQLEEEIAATRERLGDAVEELVAKLDVKSQARAQVTKVKDQVVGAARGARGQAAVKSAKARDQITGTAQQALDRTTAAAEGAPAPAKHAAATGTKLAKQRPVQIGAAAALLIAGVVIVLLSRRKK